MPVAIYFFNFVLHVPSLANGFAFGVATVFSYMINTFWSFSILLRRINLQRFVLITLIGCFLAVAVSETA